MTARKNPTTPAPAAKAKKPTITAAHKADIAAIQKKMFELAEEYDWCDVFNDAVEDLNRTLNHKIEVPAPTANVVVNMTFVIRDAPVEKDYYGEVILDDSVASKIDDAINKVLKDQGLDTVYGVDMDAHEE